MSPSPNLFILENALLDQGESVWFCNLSMEQCYFWPVECDLYFRPSYQKQFGSKIRTWIFILHHIVAQNLSDVWLSAFKIGAGQLCSITNITCQNHLFYMWKEAYPIWFLANVRAIQYYNSQPKGNWRPRLCKIPGGKKVYYGSFQMTNKKKIRGYLESISV